MDILNSGRARGEAMGEERPRLKADRLGNHDDEKLKAPSAWRLPFRIALPTDMAARAHSHAEPTIVLAAMPCTCRCDHRERQKTTRECLDRERQETTRERERPSLIGDREPRGILRGTVKTPKRTGPRSSRCGIGLSPWAAKRRFHSLVAGGRGRGRPIRAAGATPVTVAFGAEHEWGCPRSGPARRLRNRF